MTEKITYDSTKDPVWEKIKETIKPYIFKCKCIICGREIEGTAGKLAESVPICEDCMKTRKKVKRGRRT